MSAIQPNWKDAPGTGRLERYEARQKRKAVKAKADKIADQAEARRLKAIRLHVYLRDRKRCRAFGTPLLFDTDNLTKRCEIHHVIYKSAGGSYHSSNLACLSVKAHRMEHDGCLDIAGNADECLTFSEFIYEGGTRTLLKTWESRNA